jgi:DUF2934 family protein
MAVATPTTKTPIYTGPEDLTIEMPESMWQRIAAEAYALYEKRGRRQGYALRDWLDAEFIVNEEIYETH